MKMSFKDLPEVLRACKEAGVIKLKHGDLEIEFKGDSRTHDKEVSAEAIIPAISKQETENLQRESDISENLISVEELEDNLHIADPEMFERLMLEKELESPS